ncbi:MAG TPA: hypothetical protein VK145_00615 [Candidatus Nanoarchaeia archaeon]|nr:hypothetical protein [Candidatus Nanoarchaeia archaeon]
MASTISVRPLGRIAKLADRVMVPLMYLAAGTRKEAPQQTHFWNNHKLTYGAIRGLNQEMVVNCNGIKGEADVPALFAHIPILGGWRNYVVIAPVKNPLETSWYIGWNTVRVKGVSRIPITGAVRVLLGPIHTSFFGINAADNQQIAIREVRRGKIGNKTEYSHIPLL